jgi:hypothetical protein
LADDFRAVRQAVFPGDKRRLMDMRRSGTLEAIAGGAEGFGLAAKMANSIDHSNSLHRTYAPVDEVAVQNVDEARWGGNAVLATFTTATEASSRAFHGQVEQRTGTSRRRAL